MENSEAQETPMGRVCFVVFVSMCFTLAASWVWHKSDMNQHARRQSAGREQIITNTEKIAAYRDVLKGGGIEAAERYLNQPESIYGN